MPLCRGAQGVLRDAGTGAPACSPARRPDDRFGPVPRRRALAGLGGALLGLALFAWHERRSPDPLLEPALFKRRAALVAFGLIGIGAAALFAMFFFVTLYMQNVEGWSALEAGVSWLPFSAAMIGAGGVLLKVLRGSRLRPLWQSARSLLGRGRPDRARARPDARAAGAAHRGLETQNRAVARFVRRVGDPGFEPGTSSLSEKRSNRLS